MKTEPLSDGEHFAYCVTDKDTNKTVGRGFFENEEDALAVAQAHGNAEVSALAQHSRMIIRDGEMKVWNEKWEEHLDKKFGPDLDE